MAIAIKTTQRGNHFIAQTMEAPPDGNPHEVARVTYEPHLHPAGNHARACRVLLQRLAAEALNRSREWGLPHPDAGIWQYYHRWIGGATDSGYVWVYSYPNDGKDLTAHT